MRSRLITGSVLLVLGLAAMSTCRQQSASVSPEAAELAHSQSSAAVAANAPTADPTVAPGVTPSTQRAGNQTPEPERTATLTAADPMAQINVRSQPSQVSDPLGYGRVGEPVVLGRTDADDAGYTWYHVTFPNDATAGWVRSDLLAIATPDAEAVPAHAVAVSPTPSDTLRRSLDETCGGQAAVEAFFTTPSNTLYICKVRNQRIYLSQEAGTEQVVIAPDVEALGGGYIITNGNYEYRLDSGSLVVVRSDDSGRQEEVLRETIVYAERY